MSELEAVGRARLCRWCGRELAIDLRRDARFCGTSCRQAMHRFGAHGVPPARAARPMRFAYADPPYLGLARRYYAGHPSFAGEVDHRELLGKLRAFDAWALSLSSDSLLPIAALCNELGIEARTAAWFRGSRKVPSLQPLDAWEPVIYGGGRVELARASAINAFAYHARPRRTDPRRVVGAKPGPFCFWLFGLLGARPGDEFVDLFPGSGGVGLAWQLYTRAPSPTSPTIAPDVRSVLEAPELELEEPEQLSLISVRPRRVSARARRSA